MRRWLWVAALVLLHGQVAAHPHARVDQQAIVSLDRQRVVIEYRVVPSFKDGSHMFDHLDRDGDGAMSEAEKRAFAAALIRSTRMTVEGQRVALRLTAVSIPPRAAMTGGQGLLAVKATAPLRMSPDREHVVAVEVGYALFKQGWFLQPFYGSGLTRGRQPVLRRRPGLQAIVVEVPRANLIG